MPTALILDLDGTLVDTLSDLSQAMNAILAARGHPVHPEAAYRHFVGRGVHELARAALPQSSAEAAIAEAAAAMNQRYGADPIGVSRPYEGIVEALGTLTARGFVLGVLTNKPEAIARQVVRTLFPETPFVEVLGAVPSLPLKPDPSRLLALLARLGAAPEASYFAGDSDVDMITARNARMIGVGCAWGFRGRAELETAGATLVLETPAALATLGSQLD